MDECVSWTPPATFELTRRDGRLIRYCSYGPRDGFPVVSHSGSPAMRWKRPVVAEAIEQAGLRMLVPDRVTRCAVSPPDTSGPLSPDSAIPRRNKTPWLAACGEDAVRPHLEAAREIMARVDAGGPEMPPDPAAAWLRD